MIIVDYSGIAIAAIFSQDRPDEVEESIIRHMILNSLRRYNVKFRDEYGPMILACDSTSWRKEKYPQYKAKRKSSREESPLDWGKFFGFLNGIRTALRTTFCIWEAYNVFGTNIRTAFRTAFCIRETYNVFGTSIRTAFRTAFGTGSPYCFWDKHPYRTTFCIREDYNVFWDKHPYRNPHRILYMGSL